MPAREVLVQGRDGRFRDSDTVAPGNDPHPPKDTKHDVSRAPMQRHGRAPVWRRSL